MLLMIVLGVATGIPEAPLQTPEAVQVRRPRLRELCIVGFHVVDAVENRV